MWTQEHRRIYRRDGEGFPSDLRDAEWARLAPLIPPASPGGRPGKTEMRAAINAILYLLRTGCPWRYLPRDGFPPRSTVYNIFRKFQREGAWEAIWVELHMALRANGPRGQPFGRGSRQPVGEIGGKRGGKDDAVGYDAGKKVKGRKIHALVEDPSWTLVVGCQLALTSLQTPLSEWRSASASAPSRTIAPPSRRRPVRTRFRR
jgi:putative transposase